MKIALYQMMFELTPPMLCSLENVYKKYGNRVPSELYEKVFEGDVKAGNYEDIFDIFNMRYPKGYKGRAMNAGDVIEIIYQEGNNKYIYCDVIGFKSIDFDKTKTMTLVLNHDYDYVQEKRKNVSVFFICESGLLQVKCKEFEFTRCKYSQTQLGYRLLCETTDGRVLKYDFSERPSIIVSECKEDFPRELLYVDGKKARYTTYDKANLGIVCTWLVRKGYVIENLYGGCKT